jgi:RNA polymerase sigma-70 factor (sigma-E family)
MFAWSSGPGRLGTRVWIPATARSRGLVKISSGSEAAGRRAARLLSVELDDPGVAAAAHLPGPARRQCAAGESAEAAVGALYQASALGLIRLAYVMLGDLPGAEDVVQEAFCGLYRRWDRLDDADRAMCYVRASVLNGCRSVLRRRAVRRRGLADQPPAVSAEATVLDGEKREEVIRAVGRLPRRQREALVLRFYSDLSDEQIARVMGIRQSTVRSTAHRALEALGQALKETS